MPGLSTGRLAEALLPHADKGEVVDMLLVRADLSRPAELNVAAGDAMGARQAKGALNRALTVAQCRDTAPEVLAKHAKDTRVSVRRALLLNPSTPYDVVLDLTTWSHLKADESMARSILRLTAHDAVSVLVKTSAITSSSYYYPHDELATRIVATGDRALVVQAYALPYLPLRRGLAAAVYNDNRPPVTLTELVALEPDSADSVRSFLVEHQDLCTLELAEFLAGAGAGIQSHGRHAFSLMGDGAAPALLASPSVAVRLLAVRSGARGALLDDTVNQAGPALINQLVSIVKRGFTASQEKTMLKRLLAEVSRGPNPMAVNALGSLLTVCTRRVQDKPMMELLRHGGTGVTSAWLRGQFKANTPRTGQIAALVAEPHNAFATHTDAHYVRVNGSRVVSPAQVAVHPDALRRQLVADMDVAMSKEWAGEYAQALGEHLLPNLPARRHAASWVAKRFHRAFGTHEGCWETVLTLSSDWGDDIEGLVTTTLIINGIDPVEEEPTPAPTSEQLTLH